MPISISEYGRSHSLLNNASKTVFRVLKNYSEVFRRITKKIIEQKYLFSWCSTNSCRNLRNKNCMKSIAIKQLKSSYWSTAKSLTIKSKKFTYHNWRNNSKQLYKINSIRVNLLVKKPLTLFVKYQKHSKRMKQLRLKME